MRNHASNIRSLLNTFTRIYRRLNYSHLSLPDFLIIGAQKAGTSSLYSYLVQHPGIIAAERKEIHYFENPRNRRKGEGWYRSHFCLQSYKDRLAKTLGYAPLACEGTPFMAGPLVPRLAHELLPGVKIIVLLRDPVERAFSHYQHNRRYPEREPLTFEEAIVQEPLRLAGELECLAADEWYDDRKYRTFSYVNRGFYAEQLERWFAYYPKERFHIAKSEDFFTHPNEELKTVLHFLCLPEYPFDVSRSANVGGYKETISDKARNYLIPIFRSHNKKLYTLIHRNLGWPE